MSYYWTINLKRNFIDYTYEYFKNVSCKFEAARNDVTEEISILWKESGEGKKI